MGIAGNPSTNRRSTRLVLTAAIAGALGGIYTSSANAATFYWDGGASTDLWDNADLNNAANWVGDIYKPGQLGTGSDTLNTYYFGTPFVDAASFANITLTHDPDSIIYTTQDAPTTVISINSNTHLDMSPAGAGDLSFSINNTLTRIIGSGSLELWNQAAPEWNVGQNSTLSIEVRMIGSAANRGINKTGAGTLALRNGNGTGNLLSQVHMNGGTVLFDYTTVNAAKTSSTASLEINAGVMRLDGNSLAASTQTNTGTFNINRGRDTLILNAGTNQNATWTIGTFLRATGSAINFVENNNGAGVASIVSQSTGNDVTGILGGYATYNSTDWAARGGGNDIGAFAGYTVNNDATTWTTAHIDNTGAGGYTGSTNSLTINSLRFNAAGASSIQINSGQTLNVGSGGILITPNVGANNSEITGGSISTGNGTDLIIHNFDPNGAFTLSTVLGGSVGLTKVGPGTLNINAVQTYTGSTMFSGPVVLNQPFSAALLLYDGSISGTGTLTPSNTLFSRGDTASIGVPIDLLTTRNINPDDTLTLTGSITSSNGLGIMAKGGNGTLILAGNNDAFTGTFTVSTATLSVSSDSNFNAAGSRRQFNGSAMYDSVGFTQTKDVVIGSGGMTLSIGAGNTHIQDGGIRNNIIANGTGTAATRDFKKAGAGTLVLRNGIYDYSGNTEVYDGTLLVGTANVLGNSRALILQTATVNLNGFNTNMGSLNLADGRIIGPGTLTIGVGNGAVQASPQGTAGNVVSVGTSTISSDLDLGTSGTLTQRDFTVTNNGVAINNGLFISGHVGGALGINKNGVVSFNNSGTITAGVGIGNVSNLTGNGRMVLSNTNSYAGNTTVTAGTFSVDGSITSNVTVNAAQFTNSAGTLTVGISGALGGHGTVNGTVNVSGIVLPPSGGNAVVRGLLAPGDSVGKTTTGGQTWANDGGYVFEIADATGPAGTGYDQEAVTLGTGDINITAAASNPFAIIVRSLTSPTGPAGSAANFDPNGNYSWVIADAATDLKVNGASITDASQIAGLFVIDKTQFANDTTPGTFQVGLDIGNHDVLLNYVVPEPTSGVFLVGAASGLLARRRRRTRVA